VSSKIPTVDKPDRGLHTRLQPAIQHLNLAANTHLALDRLIRVEMTRFETAHRKTFATPQQQRSNCDPIGISRSLTAEFYRSTRFQKGTHGEMWIKKW
jgi:hypothetical protein